MSEIRFLIDDEALEASLEEVTAPAPLPVEVTGIGSSQPLHALRQFPLPVLQDEMVMIPHKHIAQDIDTKPVGKEAQKFQKLLVVC
ncbi:MAG: hypothetical protein O2857_24950, partial [Planctomycetota bacterium]|nr:hypothetical protein [Planctomycetota bacterium]